jgi:tRNA/rRNA methyltransferase
MRAPTRDEHRSMNLGQAVAVCLYELSRSGTVAVPSREQTPATAGELERFTQVLCEALIASGYVQSPGEAAAREKLRRLLCRLNLDKNDAELWLGMMRQILWKIKHTGRQEP